MEEENKVSLWVGNLHGNEEFNKYISESYNSDSDMISSFITDFKIEYYDEQFREALFINSNDKEEIFKDFSYSENFINDITDINFINYNCYILLYNYQYDELVKEKNNFKFVKTFTYR